MKKLLIIFLGLSNISHAIPKFNLKKPIDVVIHNPYKLYIDKVALVKDHGSSCKSGSKKNYKYFLVDESKVLADFCSYNSDYLFTKKEIVDFIIKEGGFNLSDIELCERYIKSENSFDGSINFKNSQHFLSSLSDVQLIRLVEICNYLNIENGLENLLIYLHFNKLQIFQKLDSNLQEFFNETILSKYLGMSECNGRQKLYCRCTAIYPEYYPKAIMCPLRNFLIRKIVLSLKEAEEKQGEYVLSNLYNYNQISSFYTPPPYLITAISPVKGAFTPDIKSKYTVTFYGSKFQVWEYSDEGAWNLSFKFDNCGSKFKCGAFSSDNKYLLMAYDKLILIFDIKKKKYLKTISDSSYHYRLGNGTYYCPTCYIKNITFLGNNTSFATLYDDETIKVWKIEPRV